MSNWKCFTRIWSFKTYLEISELSIPFKAIIMAQSTFQGAKTCFVIIMTNIFSGRHLKTRVFFRMDKNKTVYMRSDNITTQIAVFFSLKRTFGLTSSQAWMVDKHCATCKLWAIHFERWWNLTSIPSSTNFAYEFFPSLSHLLVFA